MKNSDVALDKEQKRISPTANCTSIVLSISISRLFAVLVACLPILISFFIDDTYYGPRFFSRTVVSPLAQNSPRDQKKIVTVVIIGAGIAGLKAAHEFRQENSRFGGAAAGSIAFDVTILEATSKFGGRIQKTDQFVDYPIDLGASFVWDPMWLAEIANRQGDDESFHVPTAYISEEGEKCGSLFVNSSWYDFVVDHLSPQDNNIVYKCPVNHIKYDGSRVDVSCSSGITYTADMVIVTVPLSILKDGDIQFDPPLPSMIVEDHPAHMWQGIKVILEFDNQFYEEFFSLEETEVTDEGECEFWDHSKVKEHTNHSVLAGYFIGEPAHRYTNMTEQEIVDHVVMRLGSYYGGDIAYHSFVQGGVINWNESPYIRGSYSSRPPPQYFSLPKDESPNVHQKVFFAGEAYPYPRDNNGWVHSAAMSGKNAAKHIITIAKKN